ncbi:hypothetical protein LVB87_03045 [Lysobacter sp. KIS68-7]|uniref:hypothetical protein n=1 Tax=Lysobacter sp. KIS68-7 TaxID=2904252 RepID=UPI001E4286BC|nr:hypothetical protein [Lysobacter sp. KIS68-7]UHQ20152.1 hypothetical protein LVB87_03045 [Lysobacter sp. KIS68-7]
MSHRTLQGVALALALALAGAAGAAHAQTVGWNPRTGDIWIDNTLGDMNRYGSRYRDPFVDELVRYHGAPRDLVVELLGPRRWTPGDVYMACSIASIIGRPCRYVVDAYDRDRGNGWGNIAKQMGIKPGSPEFHRLKQGFVPVYDRWSRPIVLDTELQRVYPNHGKDKHKYKGYDHDDHGRDNDQGEDHGNGHGHGNDKGHGNGNGKGHGKK